MKKEIFYFYIVNDYDVDTGNFRPVGGLWPLAHFVAQNTNWLLLKKYEERNILFLHSE